MSEGRDFHVAIGDMRNDVERALFHHEDAESAALIVAPKACRYLALARTSLEQAELWLRKAEEARR